MLSSFQPYGKEPEFFDNNGPFSDEGWFGRAITMYSHNTIPAIYMLFFSVGLYSLFIIPYTWDERDFNSSNADILFITLGVITFVVLVHYLFVTFVALLNKKGWHTNKGSQV